MCVFWRYRPDLNWRMRVLQTLALPLGHGTIWNKERQAFLIFFLERVTRLELATSTLARWRSTGWATPASLVPPVGIEPTTRGFSVRWSTYWATEACWADLTLLKTRRCVFNLATSNGLEPSTSSVTGWRANRLHHEAMWWWEQQGSNLWPPACKADALPAELCSRLVTEVFSSATWFIIHRRCRFVKQFFRFFPKNFFQSKQHVVPPFLR